MEKKIGYLGPRGTFTQIAVDALFNEGEKISYLTIPECIDAVRDEELDLAVVPLENAIEGSVNLTIDYLVQQAGMKIVGEVIVPIRQHLMVHPGNASKWKEIRTVYSHSHAIAQCHHFFHSTMNNVKTQFMSSTGSAAEYVSLHPQLEIGAVANELAAKEYGLTIVEKDIHDYSNNHTRFVVINKQKVDLAENNLEFKGDKTTLIVTLPSDQAGTLHQVLSAFAWRKLNLSKIESRPMKTGLGNYFFVIDIQQKMDDVLIPGAIAELESLGCKVNELGSYPHFLVNENSVKV